LLCERQYAVAKLAKELLDKEVLHQTDVEELIGKRPFGDKKPHVDTNLPDVSAPPEKTVVE